MKKVRTSINFYAKHAEKFIVQTVVKQTPIPKHTHSLPIKIHSFHTSYTRHNKDKRQTHTHTPFTRNFVWTAVKHDTCKQIK